ncbi:MAG TPA: tetratricopeptide repeat protein [Tepidisphaeraceae bacterium]|nr:tetratricopeptide repeat protein [Tepidisphaeraceae bacterium]
MMPLDQAFALAFSHFQAGRTAEAEAICRQILAGRPDQPQALHLLGLLRHRAGESDAGIELIRRAISLAPQVLGFHNDLAGILASRGRLGEALAAYQTVTDLRPGFAEAHVNCSILLLRLGRLAEAIDACERATRANPQLAEAHGARGNILFRQAKFDEAVEAYRKAVGLKPDRASFHSNLASALKCVGELTDAIAECDRATDLDAALVTAASNRIYAMHFHPAYSAAEILGEQRAWAERYAGGVMGRTFSHANDRTADRRLRIGYVAPEFRDHILGRFLLPLIREHDRDSFQIVCYSDTSAADATTEQFVTLADEWRPTVGLDHATLAERIFEDRIDVLIDTTLHMSGSRLLTFARRPAPVQVTFAGYPGGTGLRAIDYRLTDPYLDPPGADEDYVEQSIRLADTFWCYDPEQPTPPLAPLPARSNGFVTFGCLNNFAKVNEAVLSLWARALVGVKNSRMLLLAPPGRARERVLSIFQQFDIGRDRIEFVAHQPRDNYLNTYGRIDIGLDTFPYNGHMTSLDSLWMGAPVVTRVGRTAVGRAGLSQLSNLGLTDLAARDDDAFVRIASGLANDLPRLEALRSRLRQLMRRSPLADPTRFARGVEAAYRQMWRRWCAGTIRA